MAYKQWAQIKIQPVGFNAKIGKITLEWGKLHEPGYDDKAKDKEVPAARISGMEILDGFSYTIYTCGRSDSPSGTEGNVVILDEFETEPVCKIHWDSPFGNSANLLDIANRNERVKYYTSVSEHNQSCNGALGSVTITITKAK